MQVSTVQYSMPNRDIHDEGGDNERTMKMMRVGCCELWNVKNNWRKKARAVGESKRMGDEIEATRRVGANMRSSGTIGDIELKVIIGRRCASVS